MTHPFTNQPPEIAAKLLDKDLIVGLYACNSIKETGRTLGVGQQTIEKTLDYHGIPRRARGERPAPMGGGISKGMVRQLVRRAYLRNDRCPPDCPGRAECSLVDEKCVMVEEE